MSSRGSEEQMINCTEMNHAVFERPPSVCTCEMEGDDDGARSKYNPSIGPSSNYDFSINSTQFDSAPKC